MYFFNHVASVVYDYLFKFELLWSCALSSSLCYLRYESGYKEIKIETEGKGILGTIPPPTPTTKDIPDSGIRELFSSFPFFFSCQDVLDWVPPPPTYTL